MRLSTTSTIHALFLLPLSHVASASQTIDLGGIPCSNCNEPGHFCGTDGRCHEMSCENYYLYADQKLTGYSDGVKFECFGYANGDIDNAHGVIYGCDPIFPMTLITPGKQVTEPFNRKCTAEREGGYLFECYEFQPSETATNFDFFQREAESSFPDCEGSKRPKYWYIIASSNHYVGFEGLDGNPIIAGGADVDGDTLWSTNEGNFFKRELALSSIYVNVVGGPNPEPYVPSIQAGSIGGNNPLKNPKETHGGSSTNSAGVATRPVNAMATVLALTMMAQML